MARNRTIYNVLALFASQVTGANSVTGMQTGANDIKQLMRVQSFDEDFSRTLADVNQYGDLSAIDRILVEPPTVNASFSYYITNGLNEKRLGFRVPGVTGGALVSCIADILTTVTDQKNYYLLIADEGYDANGNQTTRSGVIGIGNGFITSYSVNAAVGEIPTASVDIEALNVRVYSNTYSIFGSGTGIGGGNPLPSINQADGTNVSNKFMLPLASPITGTAENNVSALIPGDITFSIPTSGTMGYDNTDLKVQDFTLTVDLARTPLQKIGSRFPFTRVINFPLTASLEVNAEVGDLTSGNLVDILCNNSNFDFDIDIKKPGCAGTTRDSAMKFQFKGAKLMSQNFSSSIGNNATMSATYEVQIGSAAQTDRGVFISGSFPDGVI